MARNRAEREYPERTADLVIPYAAGGGIDLLLRSRAEGFSTRFKQSFVVSNRTGAIGVAYVARSAPDGYTLLFVPALVHSVLAADAKQCRLQRKILRADLPDIREPDGADRAAAPFKSAREIVEAARAKPNSVSFASTATGTITHLAGAALADAGKVKLNHVPFRGDGDLMGQLIGGHMDFASVTLASAAAAGPSVRVIGIFADARNPSLPDAPTVKVQGYDVAPTSFGGLFAPSGTPPDVMGKLAAGCRFGVQQPGYVDLAKRLHQGTRYYAGAAAFAKRLEADVADKRQLLERGGLVK